MRGYGILKSTAVALILFAALFGLVACSGVSQEEFDRVSDDLAASQSKVKDIETELDYARAKQAEYSKIVETDYPDLSFRAEQARLILAVFNEFIHIGITGDASHLVQLFGQLAEVENPGIQQSVEYLLDNGESISDDEAGMIVMGWLIEAEKMLGE